MSKDKMQFQRGMSLHKFMAQYGTAAQCAQALFAWRWPQGFVCPACGNTRHCTLQSRRLFQCNACGRQTSVTAGTVFAGSKLALNVWFLAMHLITQAKNGISSLELSRQLGISQNSAWLMKHKLMQAMLERERARQLSGLVQLDGAYWGGRRRGYKRGRGTRGKTPFVAAVETDDEGRPQRMSLNKVRGTGRVSLGTGGGDGNSRRSSAVSLSPSGKGQLRPTAARRRSYSLTLLWAICTLAATWRADSPTA